MRIKRLRAANLERMRLEEVRHSQDIHEARMRCLRRDFKKCLEDYASGKPYHKIACYDEDYVELLFRAVGYIIPVRLEFNVYDCTTLKKGLIIFLVI